MGRWVLLGCGLVVLLVLQGVSSAQSPPPDYQQTVAVTETNTTVTFTFPAGSWCAMNDGAADVVYDVSGTATFSATAKAAIKPGETLCVTSEGSVKYRQLGLITDAGLTSSVRLWAR